MKLIKPAVLRSQADSTRSPDVTTIATVMLRQQNKPNNVFVGFVHRLTSAVMVRKRGSKATRR
ncbi:MAG: hypothetical protein OXF08_04865 [Bacteroidetes bacterium]|nr:hypothetical protein [Bacteroidota bacterium]